MNVQDIERAKIALWMHYNDEINETQYYFRMNQCGFSEDDATNLFNLFSDYVNTVKKKNVMVVSVLLISLFAFFTGFVIYLIFAGGY